MLARKQLAVIADHVSSAAAAAAAAACAAPSATGAGSGGKPPLMLQLPGSSEASPSATAEERRGVPELHGLYHYSKLVGLFSSGEGDEAAARFQSTPVAALTQQQARRAGSLGGCRVVSGTERSAAPVLSLFIASPLRAWQPPPSAQMLHHAGVGMPGHDVGGRWGQQPRGG